MSQSTSAPVTFEIDYPERLSRLHLLLKTLFGWFYVLIPHGMRTWRRRQKVPNLGPASPGRVSGRQSTRSVAHQLDTRHTLAYPKADWK